MSTRLASSAKNLRKNQTDVEKLLWQKLKARQIEGVKFRRQQPIGDFVVDFVSFEKRLIIELDGGQHTVMRKQDIERDKVFIEKGYKVLRFWNGDVLENEQGVLEVIRENCMK
jgi:very-short-patch-repair endonuclease